MVLNCLVGNVYKTQRYKTRHANSSTMLTFNFSGSDEIRLSFSRRSLLLDCYSKSSRSLFVNGGYLSEVGRGKVGNTRNPLINSNYPYPDLPKVTVLVSTPHRTTY